MTILETVTLILGGSLLGFLGTIIVVLAGRRKNRAEIEKIIADTYDNASVMFLDIVGFTSLASQAPASHLVHLLNAVFERCDAVCDQFDLSKIKTIGDSYLAISGMPALREDHAQRIASAALALVRELQLLRRGAQLGRA